MQELAADAVECGTLPLSGGWSYNPGQSGQGDGQERLMGEPIPDKVPSVTTPEDRLDSWKEIAAYLNRDVTTVQRWEKREGMPVHRHVHDKRGSV